MKKLIIISLILVISACQEEKPKEWAYQKTVKLDGVNPIGIAVADGKLWLSDGDHNRLVQIDDGGNIAKTIDSLNRPMHIDALGETLFIPQYGNDKVETFDKKGRFELQLKDSLDAPAGVGLYKNERAIVDFYNNRILFKKDGDWISFGKEGKAEGEFYYPTDVQITDSLIWVADAYNNRVQVFDKTGKFVKMFGQDQKMNAATGLFVSENEVFVTDFENNRILIFDHDGNLKQELKKGIAKATDLLVKDGELHIVNYRSGELVRYELRAKKKS
ncbi:NHL repeat-containing protein [Allomuricauda sp. d1]|uniref:NHL repeat-containing protein n=1 Tax=Allomuricauda sp. d1 TaxID=3136725 RepID=UPI0031D60BD0